jgi:polar amino acid transport system substrate-binding protein
MVILLLGAMALTACGGKSGADGSLDRVKKAGKLTIGMDTTYPPMEFVENGKTVGFDKEFADALAAKLGVTAEAQTVDWNGIITGLKSKRYDVIISSMNITDERKKEVNFVEYARMSQVFVTKKGAPALTA